MKAFSFTFLQLFMNGNGFHMKGDFEVQNEKHARMNDFSRSFCQRNS